MSTQVPRLRRGEGRVAVVTGANQGLGYALVNALCRALGPDGIVYLTARDPDRGQAAAAALGRAGRSPVFHPLDVTVQASVDTLAEMLRARHGGVDVVISNAAARVDPVVPQAAQVRRFVETNNHGTTRIMRALGPLLRDGARYLVVASSFGTLGHLALPLQNRFDISTASLADIDEAMNDYVAAVEDGRAASLGWPDWINVPSKIGQVAATKVFARDIWARAECAGILIDAVCPGLVDTEASRPWFRDMAAAQTPAAAARDIVWLATLSDDVRVPYAELVQHRRALVWQYADGASSRRFSATR
ncbi:MAG: SDR family NAD(P)-dependent oxidoreductase [Acidobacteria bacterium]|nr:SDR family NAD(P)-dependent oxidoreductase [Acidobacteriota bacterium]